MDRIKTAVILAAGLGSRISSFSRKLPKGFIPIDGVPIIERSITNLIDLGIQKIIIGTGHKSEAYDGLIPKYPEIVCKRNQFYSSTGSMYTLFNLRNLVDQDFLLLESDLLYEKNGLDSLVNHPNRNVMLASGDTKSGDEVFIEVNERNHLQMVSKDKFQLSTIFGEMTGISKISIPLFDAINQHFTKAPGLDYEYALAGVSKEESMLVYKINDYPWCEIDNEEHLSRAVNVVYPLIKK